MAAALESSYLKPISQGTNSDTVNSSNVSKDGSIQYITPKDLQDRVLDLEKDSKAARTRKTILIVSAIALGVLALVGVAAVVGLFIVPPAFLLASAGAALGVTFGICGFYGAIGAVGTGLVYGIEHYHRKEKRAKKQIELLKDREFTQWACEQPISARLKHKEFYKIFKNDQQLKKLQRLDYKTFAKEHEIINLLEKINNLNSKLNNKLVVS